jgi:hypothetical protein
LIHRPRIIRRAPGYSSLLQNKSALFLEFGLVDLTLRETLLQISRAREPVSYVERFSQRTGKPEAFDVVVL